MDREIIGYTVTPVPSGDPETPAEPPASPADSIAQSTGAIDDVALRSTGVQVEMVLDSYRVIGELHAPGVPRRLVDIMNSSDLSYFVMRTGTLDDPFDPSAEPKSFDVIQLDRAGILFAMPRGDVKKPDPFEVVRKKPVPSTAVLPGFSVTGQLYLMPDADPALVPIVADHHFVPFTDAIIVTDKGRPETWHEPLVIVNMTRVLFYGTRKGDSSAA